MYPLLLHLFNFFFSFLRFERRKIYFYNLKFLTQTTLKFRWNCWHLQTKSIRSRFTLFTILTHFQQVFKVATLFDIHKNEEEKTKNKNIECIHIYRRYPFVSLSSRRSFLFFYSSLHYLFDSFMFRLLSIKSNVSVIIINEYKTRSIFNVCVFRFFFPFLYLYIFDDDDFLFFRRICFHYFFFIA